MATVTVSLPNTTFISSANPNSNYSYYPLIYCGVDPSFGTCLGYLNIPLPDLPVSVVDSAKLRLSVIVKNGGNPSPIAVLRATEPFSTETVTYLTQPSVVPTASGINVTTADLYQTVEIDITALVNQWIGGTFPNDGIALANADVTTLVEFATNVISYPPYFPQLVITYSTSPVGPATAANFSLSQLAHVIQQIIAFYPTSTLSVFTSGFVANTITGIPSGITLSPGGTYGGLFILTDTGQQELIPLDTITAIYTGEGTVYNPNFTYLTAPTFAEGADKYIVTGIHDSLSLSENITIYMRSNITASGTVYQNPYGVIVLSDASSPGLFIPVTGNITLILPAAQNGKRSAAPQISAEKPEDASTPQTQE
jgi:hypothetical protein